jgi:hypothetical protein
MLVVVVAVLATLERVAPAGLVAVGTGLQTLPPVALELQIQVVAVAGQVALLQRVALAVQA